VALHGEVPDYPAYAHLRPIEGGSHALVQIGWHVGFGINCAQKTFERPGRDAPAAQVGHVARPLHAEVPIV
jgi:hypothetical protein